MSHRTKGLNLLVVGLLLTTMLLTVLPTFAQGGVQVTTTSALRLRSAPSTSGQILATVPGGTALTATATNASRTWVVVTYNGITGWMAASFLSISGSLSGLPITDNAGSAPAPQPQSPAPTGGVIVAPTSNLRMRSGPGTNNAVVVTIPRNTQIQAIAVNADRTWVQVTYNGQNGWVARQFIRVISGNLDTLTGTPQQPQQPANPNISFTATTYSVSAGQCVTLSWNVTNAREVYYQNQPVTGQGSRQECPGATTTYVLRVITQAGQTVDTPATITVTGGSANVSFTSTAYNISAGQCVTLTWNVSNVREVYYQGQPVTGQGSRQECPGSTSTYTLRVVNQAGQTVDTPITITVSGGSAGLNPSGSPNYGSQSLTSGWNPDPFTRPITSGGSTAVSSLGSACRGYATSSPDFRVTYTSGAWTLLRFYFIAGSGDTTLVINAPNGSWWCSDDSYGSLNPTIDFNNPASGTYNIWVGSYSAGNYISGILYVTELSGNHP